MVVLTIAFWVAFAIGPVAASAGPRVVVEQDGAALGGGVAQGVARRPSGG